jgi:hypothetical protein
MLRKLFALLSFILFFMSVTFFLLVPAEGQPDSESTGQQEYSVPEDKKQEWENIKNHVLNEYKVCEEHCGNDSDCLNRCERVYRHRLETEHKKLTHE